MDIQPVNPGHVLVVPVAHAQFVSDLEPATLAHLATVAQRITSTVRACGVRCGGVNWWLADGEAAGQEVPHVHLHVFPRFTGDGFGLTFGPDYSSLPARGSLDQIAAQIRDGLRQATSP